MTIRGKRHFFPRARRSNIGWAAWAKRLSQPSLFLCVGLALHRTYANALSGDAMTADLAATFLRGFIRALALQFSMVGLGSALRVKAPV